MALPETGTGISQVEQFLFYSIPGGILLLFVGTFVIFKNPGSIEAISPGIVGAGIASAIPIGFLLYQAYTSNVLWVYGLCLQRRKQKCLMPIQKEFQRSWKNGDPEEIYQLSKRVLTRITSDDSYIWRLVAIINARGVSLFACVIAAFLPLSYAFAIKCFSSGCWPAGLLGYYILLLLVSVSLYGGVPKVRSQLDAYQELIVADRRREVVRLVRQFARGRAGPS